MKFQTFLTMKKILILISILLSNQQLFAQTPTLISDTTPMGNNPTTQSQTFLNGVLIFSANSNQSIGNELWRSDGTAAGTVLVKDIYSGGSNSNPRYFYNLNASTVLFNALDINGFELWKTDGTTAGTVMVKDIASGYNSSNPMSMQLFNGKVYFSANSCELWKTDGNSGGTELVKSLLPSASDGYILNIVATPIAIYIVASTYAGKRQLWKSDGTSEGTVFIKEFDFIYLEEDNTLNGNQFFSANDGISGNELWKTDGTTAGTVLVKDIGAGSNGVSPAYLTIFNNLLYFSGFDSFLWKSDGTDAGTQQVSSLGGYGMENIGGKLYFFNFDQVGSIKIWVSDNTANNFTLLKTFDRFNNYGWNPRFIGVGGKVYFNGSDRTYGEELWQLTPNTTNTNLPVLVSDIRLGIYGSSPQKFIVNPNSPNDLYFWADDGTTGFELYRFQGNLASPPVFIKDIESNITGSHPSNFTKLNDYLLYSGINNGVNRLFSINMANVSLYSNNLYGTNPSFLLAHANKAYFQAYGGSPYGNELYVTDGNSYNNTFMLKDIYPGSANSNPSELTTVGSNFYFAATTSVGRELWKSDGTDANTVLVKDINTISTDSNPNHLIEFGGNLYFFADAGAYFGAKNIEVWKSVWNGTTEITSEFSNINPSGSSIDVLNGEMKKTTTHLFVQANNGTLGYEIYVSDGTAINLLKDIKSGSGSSNPANFTPIGNILYFTADDGTNGVELWKTDGTAVGTVMVKNINTSAGAGSNPQNLYNLNGVLYFSASNGGSGFELYKSDGTAAGTTLVKDIYEGILGSGPADLCGLGNTLYFVATHPKFGRELWKSDGTAAGTVLVYELFENYNSENNDANPNSLFSMNGKLFFVANNGLNGEELFVFTPCPTIGSFSQYTYPQSSTFHAVETVTASHKIQYGKSLNYFAGKSILLSPGFSISAKDVYSTNSNTFRAEIRGCN